MIDMIVFAQPIHSEHALMVERCVFDGLAEFSTKKWGREWFYGLDFTKVKSFVGGVLADSFDSMKEAGLGDLIL